MSALQSITAVIETTNGQHAAWMALEEPIPAGTLIVESDTLKTKIGDGVKLYSELPYYKDFNDLAKATHPHTKKDIGLENILDAPIATDQEIDAGQATDRYVTTAQGIRLLRRIAGDVNDVLIVTDTTTETVTSIPVPWNIASPEEVSVTIQGTPRLGGYVVTPTDVGATVTFNSPLVSGTTYILKLASRTLPSKVSGLLSDLFSKVTKLDGDSLNKALTTHKHTAVDISGLPEELSKISDILITKEVSGMIILQPRISMAGELSAIPLNSATVTALPYESLYKLAIKYGYIEVATDSTFTNIVYNSSTEKSRTHTIPKEYLSELTEYFVRWRDTDNKDRTSKYSDILNFTTGQWLSVSTPQIVAPLTVQDSPLGIAIVGSAFEVSVGTDTHISTQIELSRTEDFASIIYTNIISDGNLLQCVIPDHTIAYDETVYARIKYKGAGYGWTDWSSVAPISIGSLEVETPYITAPENMSTFDKHSALSLTLAEFTASDGIDVAKYTQVQVSNTSSFDSILWDSYELSYTYNPTIPWIDTLDYNDSIYVRVRFEGESYGWTGWSPTKVYTVQPVIVETPSISSPGPDASIIGDSEGDLDFITVTTTPFKVTTNNATLDSLEVQMSTTSDFVNIVSEKTVVGSDVNIALLDLANVKTGPVIHYLRCRYKFNSIEMTPWSTVVKINRITTLQQRNTLAVIDSNFGLSFPLSSAFTDVLHTGPQFGTVAGIPVYVDTQDLPLMFAISTNRTPLKSDYPEDYYYVDIYNRPGQNVTLNKSIGTSENLNTLCLSASLSGKSICRVHHSTANSILQIFDYERNGCDTESMTPDGDVWTALDYSIGTPSIMYEVLPTTNEQDITYLLAYSDNTNYNYIRRTYAQDHTYGISDTNTSSQTITFVKDVDSPLSISPNNITPYCSDYNPVLNKLIIAGVGKADVQGTLENEPTAELGNATCVCIIDLDTNIYTSFQIAYPNVDGGSLATRRTEFRYRLCSLGNNGVLYVGDSKDLYAYNISTKDLTHVINSQGDNAANFEGYSEITSITFYR